MRDTRVRDSISHAVVRVFRRGNRAHNKALKPLGISSLQAHILTVLWEQAPLSVGELQRRLSMGSSTLTGALDRMVKQELVVREPSETDRRSFQVRPAKWPARRRNKVLGTLAETEDEIYGDLSAAERDTLLSLLHRLLEP